MFTSTPPRPTVTDDLVMKALSKYHADKAEEWNFEDIVKEYCPSKDGYELMRDLERHCFWEGSQALMEDLGEINFSVQRTIKEVIKEWVSAYQVRPSLGVGEDVGWQNKKAKIIKINRESAQYSIQFYEPYSKSLPCTIGSDSAILANFEDVKELVFG